MILSTDLQHHYQLCRGFTFTRVSTYTYSKAVSSIHYFKIYRILAQITLGECFDSPHSPSLTIPVKCLISTLCCLFFQEECSNLFVNTHNLYSKVLHEKAPKRDRWVSVGTTVEKAHSKLADSWVHSRRLRSSCESGWETFWRVWMRAKHKIFFMSESEWVFADLCLLQAVQDNSLCWLRSRHALHFHMFQMWPSSNTWKFVLDTASLPPFSSQALATHVVCFRHVRSLFLCLRGFGFNINNLQKPLFTTLASLSLTECNNQGCNNQIGPGKIFGAAECCFKM